MIPRERKDMVDRGRAQALNEAFDTDLFAGGLLIGEATVTAKVGDAKG